MRTLRGIARVAAFSAALIAGGCMQAPSREAQPAPPPEPPPATQAPPAAFRMFMPDNTVLARDRNFAIVVAQPGEDLAVLAERWLGDRSRRPVIAEFNRLDEVRAGQTVAIPLKAPNAMGVSGASAQAVTILCYHRFGPRANALTVTPAAFEAQMNYLAKNGYTVIPLDRMSDFLEGRASLPDKAIVLTIDDGYRSTFEIAYPILRKHHFPATLFLYSDFVGVPDALTWPQMKEMAGSGLVDIQPHSKTHANLTLRLADESDARYRERTRREVEGPANIIRKELGLTSRAFAFPYGDVNDTVMNELRANGVKLGVTVTPGGNAFYAPPYMLRRTMIFGGDDLDTFKGKLVSAIAIARN